MSDFDKCPNCNAELKSNFLKSNELISENKTNIIKEYAEKPSKAYCNKCGSDLYQKSKAKLESEKNEVRSRMRKLLNVIPVITVQSPLNWDYKILEMVTGQSTTGTGVISEFTSSFTDMIGGQSGRHNQKIRNGEEMCINQLRIQALNLGGNAVIATDIDYSEVGANKGMLMVCMSGTAIVLNNIDILGEGKESNLNELKKDKTRLEKLNSFVLDAY